VLLEIAEVDNENVGFCPTYTCPPLLRFPEYGELKDTVVAGSPAALPMPTAAQLANNN
tara:strand:- start:664 stop:837 length:174 start_codon:yes stop_codon:yes gene_type:complete